MGITGVLVKGACLGGILEKGIKEGQENLLAEKRHSDIGLAGRDIMDAGLCDIHKG
jgi:hypothetical protein